MMAQHTLDIPLAHVTMNLAVALMARPASDGVTANHDIPIVLLEKNVVEAVGMVSIISHQYRLAWLWGS